MKKKTYEKGVREGRSGALAALAARPASCCSPPEATLRVQRNLGMENSLASHKEQHLNIENRYILS